MNTHYGGDDHSMAWLLNQVPTAPLVFPMHEPCFDDDGDAVMCFATPIRSNTNLNENSNTGND